MIKLQFDDGQTVRVNLDDEQEAERWAKAFGDLAFQARIRSAMLLTGHARKRAAGDRSLVNVQESIARPDAFGAIWYEAEVVEHRGRPVGERIVVFADDVRLTVTSYQSQPASRIELVKLGKRRIRT